MRLKLLVWLALAAFGWLSLLGLGYGAWLLLHAYGTWPIVRFALIVFVFGMSWLILVEQFAEMRENSRARQVEAIARRRR